MVLFFFLSVLVCGMAFSPCSRLQLGGANRGTGSTRVYNLNQHIDALSGQFEASSVEGLPAWVQDSIVGTGLNQLTFDEANNSLLSFQLLVIGLAMYVSQQRYGTSGAQGQTQLTADKIREERRRRSKFDDEPETLEDVDVGSWFRDDDGREEKR